MFGPTYDGLSTPAVEICAHAVHHERLCTVERCQDKVSYDSNRRPYAILRILPMLSVSAAAVRLGQDRQEHGRFGVGQA
jgi:hypothetical protein